MKSMLEYLWIGVTGCKAYIDNSAEFQTVGIITTGTRMKATITTADVFLC